MNNFEIKNVLQKNLWQPHYYEVCPSDGLTHLMNLFFPAALVVNTGDSSTRGYHWQALYIPQDVKECLFFCSLGLEPSEEVKRFCKLLDIKLCFTSKKVQHPLASSCGLFACDFIIQQSKWVSLPVFHSRYKSTKYNFNENELMRHWTLDKNDMSLKYYSNT